MQRIGILLIVILHLNIASLAANINLTHLTVKDGLMNSTVYYAMQDSKGFMWFCTETGVSRYDGERFENFTLSEGLADNEIFKCYEDSKGRIWFLSYNGKLSFYFTGRIYNSNNTPWLRYPLTGPFLISCIEDKNGILWFVNSLGDVLKLKDTVISIINAPFTDINHNNFYITSYIFSEQDSAKKFVIDQSKGEIYLFNLNNRQLKYLGNYPGICKKESIKDYIKTQDASARIFFITDKGFISYNSNNKLSLINLDAFGIRSKIFAVFKDETYLWVATESEGVYKINLLPGKNEKIQNLLKGELVTKMLKDNEGNIWFVTHDNGVFVLKNNTRLFTTLLTQITFSIKPIIIQNDKRLICGDNHGNIIIAAADSIILKHHLSVRQFNRVLDIISYKNSTVLIGCDDGLYEINIKNGEKLKYYPNSLAGYKNYAIAPDSSLWFCTQDRVTNIKGNKVTLISTPLHHLKYTSIAVLSDSVYYIGTTSKLYKISGNSSSIILDDSILKTQVSGLKIINNLLWVATHGNGIFILKDDKISRHLTVKTDSLISDICQKLYDDKKKFVWLATNKGISVIDKNNFRIYNNISSDIGLASNDIRDISTDNEFVYAATAEGTSIFKLNELNFNTTPPKVYVTGFKKGDKYIIDPGDNISFDYFKGFINISFTAITFQSPQNIQYEYKFANESNWHYTLSTDIPFFALSPGTHELLFRAKKPNSSWSEPVLLSVKVNPLWYQATSFRLAIILAILFMIYYIVYRRIRSIQRKVKEENELNKKIAELENKSLASQMNPHFIFNSLNTVQQLILVKEEQQGLNYLSDFAMLMRQMLENSRKPYITLREEIQFLDRYMQLEVVRYNNRFEYIIKTDENLQPDEINIPPVLLQPVLENAVKYGISSLKSSGLITLGISRENGFIKAVIEDNGNGIYSGQNEKDPLLNKKESTALKLLEERLKLIKNYKGQNGSIKITDKRLENKSKQGTIVEIMVPVIT